MSGNGQEKTGLRERAPRLCVGLALGAIAVAATHAYLFRSGFRLTPGDPSDAALINYLVERDYRWMTGMDHGGLWDPPMYYPHRDTATYTDLLLGAVPFYLPFRLAGASPQTAFQLWFLMVAYLNYIGLYVVLRRLLRYGEAASNAACFLFACGSARVIQEWHPQLTPEFYAVASLAGLILFFRESSPRPLAGAVLLLSGLVLQAYTAIYWVFFSWFCLALALVFAVLRKDWRGRLISRSVENVGGLMLAGTVSFLVMLPLLLHTLHGIREVGVRNYAEVRGLLPSWISWFNQSQASYLYGWWSALLKRFQNPQFWEEANGLGVVTSGMVVCGFLAGRRRTHVLLSALVCMAAIALTLRLYSGASLWPAVYRFFPGANAVRAVGRIGLFLSLSFAIAVAQCLDSVRTRVAWALAAVLAAEQAVAVPAYDKFKFRSMVDQAAGSLRGQNCEAFLYSPSREALWSPVLAQTVAMWAALESRVPTLNAYSGTMPPGWRPFEDPRIDGGPDEARLRQALADWRAEEHWRPQRLCWIRSDGTNLKLRVE